MTRFHNMNAHYENIDGMVYFFSYDTLVMVHDEQNDVVTLLQNWDYSASTTRQIMRYIREYYPMLYWVSARDVKKEVYDVNGVGVFNGVTIRYEPQPCGKLNAYHVAGTPLRFCV